jgi:transposase-like protein
LDVPLPRHRSVGDTVEFWFSEHRNLPAAECFLRKASARHGRPDRIVIDGSQTNREAIISCDAENCLQDRSRRALKPKSVQSRTPIRSGEYLQRNRKSSALDFPAPNIDIGRNSPIPRTMVGK